MSTTTYGFETTAAEVAAGIDLSGKRVDRHRRLVGHRRRDRPRAGGRRRRGHARRPRRRRRASAPPPTSTATSASRRWTWPTRRRSRAFAAAWDGPLHVLVNNAGVMAIQEIDAHARGLGDAVRDQPPRALRARRSACTTRWPPTATPASSRSARPRTCARRSCGTTSTSTSASTTPWAAYGQSKTANVLFAVEATRPLGRRRHHRQLADAGRHRHAPAAPPRAGLHAAGPPRRQPADQDDRAGRRDLGAARRLARPRGRRRPLLRGLQRGRGDRAPRGLRRVRRRAATRSTRPTPSGSGTSPCGCSAGTQASGSGAPCSDSGRGPWMRRSDSSIATSLMLASRRRM